MSSINFKNIHIGSLIHQRVLETGMDTSRISNFFKCTYDDIEEMYKANHLDTKTLLEWSKLLKYDFFRIYTQHLILFHPADSLNYNNIASNHKKSDLPSFRKNIYTKGIIFYVLELIESNKKTKQQVVDDYHIPKTTLYQWIRKYQI